MEIYKVGKPFSGITAFYIIKNKIIIVFDIYIN